METVSLKPEPVEFTYSSLKKKRLIIRAGIFILLAILTWLGVLTSKINLDGFISGIHLGVKFTQQLFPPDWNALTDLFVPALQTISIALLSTIFGVIISFLIALGGAGNLSPNWVKTICRLIMAVERALPEIIIILLLIASLGLGPFPGVVALSIGCIGMLGRLFSDAIEEINPKIIESIKATGASFFQVVFYGVIPETLPSLIANSIFRFEVNIRLSVLLGAVGAGGIGYELYYSFQLLEYHKATTAILIILLLIFLSERASDFFRRKIWKAEQLK